MNIYKQVFGHESSFLSGMYVGVEYMGYMVTLGIDF